MGGKREREGERERNAEKERVRWASELSRASVTAQPGLLQEIKSKEERRKASPQGHEE